jgi:ubiquinone biosynthesis protein
MHQMRQAMLDAGDLASRLPDDVNAILSKFRQGKFQVHVQHEHLEMLTRTLDRSSNRISFALIIAALLIGSSMLVAQENLQEMGVVGYMIAAVFGVWLLVSIIRGGRL